jgi:drug/metabolite transporter (DMT)-like permease
MQWTNEKIAYLKLHICVLLWGFTAILGALISLTALSLVWWRVMLSAMIIFPFLPKQELFKVPRRILLRIMGIGVIIGIHWICFYGAIKLANASIGVVTMATGAVFSALVEPFIAKKRFEPLDVMLGLLIIPGMYLIVESIDWSMRLGFWIGIFSAFMAAVFTSFNKKLLHTPGAPEVKLIAFIQFLTIGVMIGLVLMVMRAIGHTPSFLPSTVDWLWLGILASACTVLPFVLSLQSLKHLSAFTTNLTINLEPVYGILLAVVLLNEHKMLHTNFYIGVAVILTVVFGYPFIKQGMKIG